MHEKRCALQMGLVARQWDAVLEPLFHVAVPGVVTSAELRRIKRVALGGQGEWCNRHGWRLFRTRRFELPERVTQSWNHNSPGGTNFFVDTFLKDLHHSSAWPACKQAMMRRARASFYGSVTSPSWRNLILGDLFSGGSEPPPATVSHPRNMFGTTQTPYILHVAITAYRLMMVVKAVETLAAGKSPEVAGTIPAHWRTRASPGALADAVWHAHLDSAQSYAKTCHELLGVKRKITHVRAPDRAEGMLDKLLELFPYRFSKSWSGDLAERRLMHARLLPGQLTGVVDPIVPSSPWYNEGADVLMAACATFVGLFAGPVEGDSEEEDSAEEEDDSEYGSDDGFACG